MPELTPEIVDQIMAACRSGADEAAEAFGRALDAEISVSVGQPGSVDLGTLPTELAGPGLVVVLTVGSVGLLVLLPETSGLVPEWCRVPDATGESKLTTLAQELGQILLPEELTPDDFRAAWVETLEGALRQGAVTDGAGLIPIELTAGDHAGTAQLMWPAATPAAVFESPGSASSQEPEPEPQPQPASASESATGEVESEPNQRKAQVQDLPDYTRSLLRIKVPVVVALAHKRQPLGRIVELGPGSIIQFQKPCEEMLEMDVGNCRVAHGEAVKVGDKFGLRVTSIVLPEERFQSVKPGTASETR
jgi:flagellar motor switch/type III secretory pathway protein FliN